MTLGIDKKLSYVDLLVTFPPRPIRSEEQLQATQKIINILIDQEDLSSDQREYLNLLGILVYEYEEEHYPLSEIQGVDLLKALLAASNLSQKALVPIFGMESIVSGVLSGNLQLSCVQMQQLSELFQVSPSVFSERNT